MTPLEAFDFAAFGSILGYFQGSPDWFWLTFSSFGSGVMLGVISALVAWLLWRRGDRPAAIFLGVAFVGAHLLQVIAKFGFGRARPGIIDPAVFGPDPLRLYSWDPMSGSFPSGHALESIVVLGYLMTVVPSRWRIPAALAAIPAIVLIGASRVTLGAHWPSDVIGGWVLGALWLASVLWARWTVQAQTRSAPEGPPRSPADS